MSVCLKRTNKPLVPSSKVLIPPRTGPMQTGKLFGPRALPSNDQMPMDADARSYRETSSRFHRDREEFARLKLEGHPSEGCKCCKLLLTTLRSPTQAPTGAQVFVHTSPVLSPLHPGSDVSAPNHNTTQYEPARSTPAMTSKRARDNRGGFPAATRRCQWHMPHSKRAILINAPSFPVRRLVLGGPAAARGLPRFELVCTAPHPLLPAAAAQPNSSCKSQSKPHPTAVLIATYCRTAKRR